MLWSIIGMRRQHRNHRFSYFFLMGLLLSIVILMGAASAQDEPLVVFIIGQDIGSSTYADTTPIGLSKLAIYIDSLGITPRTIEAGQPIPDSTRLVIISRPTNALSFALEARLWDYMQGGGHVLLTLDPESYFWGGLGNINPRFDESGLRTLFRLDYGLDVTNAFLIEPWISNRSFATLPPTYSFVLPSDVLNPITDPLLTYEVPVRLWGARHIKVDPLGINSYAFPLFYNTWGYGETDSGVFPQIRDSNVVLGEAPLEANIGVDVLGRIEPGAVAVNIRTGSRLVVLGDSEVLQNGFGLDGTQLSPAYPGDRIFVERLIAWLLEIPVRNWPSLPQGYTWLAIDGQADDWTGIDDALSLENVSDAGNSILFQSVSTFRDDRYAYFLFVTDTPLPADVQISLQHADNTIVAQAGQANFSNAASETELIEEARFVVGSVAEIRLPLRYLKPDFTVDALCLSSEGQSSCADVSLSIPQVDTLAPFDHTLIGHMTGVVVTDQGVTVNMRASPSTDSGVVDFVPVGTPLALLGRDLTANWVFAENANYRGWIAAILLETNGDVFQLPLKRGS